MREDYLQYYKSKVLLTAVALFAISLYIAKDRWGISISIIGIVTGFLGFTTKFLWKYKPFIWLFRIDDFSGRYEIKYQFIDDKGQTQTGILEHVKVINQTGYRITVTSFTKRTDGIKSTGSTSKGLYVKKTEDEQHYEITYHYLNDGCTARGFPAHYGTEILKFIKDDKEKYLSGRYYTERQPFQTRGELINMKWVGNNKKHEF